MIFWIKLSQKVFFLVRNKTNEKTLPFTSAYLNYSVDTKFHFIKQPFLFSMNLPKQIFSVQNRNIKQHDRIQHISISLDVKCRLYNRQFCFFCLICPKSVEKPFFIINIPRIPFFSRYYEILLMKKLFKKFVY